MHVIGAQIARVLLLLIRGYVEESSTAAGNQAPNQQKITSADKQAEPLANMHGACGAGHGGCNARSQATQRHDVELLLVCVYTAANGTNNDVFVKRCKWPHDAHPMA
jgi:hypothetical protein